MGLQVGYLCVGLYFFGKALIDGLLFARLGFDLRV